MGSHGTGGGVEQEARAEGGSVVVQVGRDLVVKVRRSPGFRWGTVGVVLVLLASAVWWSAARTRWTYALPDGRVTLPVRTTTTEPAPEAVVPPPVVVTSVVREAVAVPEPSPEPVPVVTTTVPVVPRIVIGVGAPTSSSSCEKGKCYWIATRLSGFAPDKRVEVVAIGNRRDFSEPCVAVTDASGAAECDRTRYDVPGAEVYAYVDTPAGRVESNRIVWPS